MASPSDMTVLELTQRVLAQDTRWADILTHAQGARHPLTARGVAFFRNTWRPVLDSYMEGVASRHAPEERVPAEVVNWWLDLLAARIYPAARGVGFSEGTFLFPEITIDQGGRPSTVAGAEAPPSGPRLDWKGWGLVAVAIGLGYFVFVRPAAKKHEEAALASSAAAREAGIQKGMTRAQEDAAWDAFYARHGFRLQDGDLVKVS